MAEENNGSPISPAIPPKASPLGKPLAGKLPTVKLNPVIRKPTVGATQTGLKPGLKLPTKTGLPTGGLKLPTQNAVRPGLKLPTKTMKPVIRKPGATVTVKPLPKPIVGAPTAAAPAPAAPAPASPSATVEAKPLPVDTQGVGKLPTVSATAVGSDGTPSNVPEMPKPLEQLKSVTQKLKGITGQIPAQAILRKTGIIADSSLSDAQKEASKHKTARISLSDAMGVAPVKNENAPMKTIRIKRPIDIPGSTSKKLSPVPPPTAAKPKESDSEAATVVSSGSEEPKADAPATTITQRKTLKIARPGGTVRPTGKFGVKRPAPTKPSVAGAQAPAAGGENGEAVPEIADIPSIPDLPAVESKPVASEGPAWLIALSTLVQAAACVAMGALAWLLFQNAQVAYF